MPHPVRAPSASRGASMCTPVSPPPTRRCRGRSGRAVPISLCSATGVATVAPAVPRYTISRSPVSRPMNARSQLPAKGAVAAVVTRKLQVMAAARPHQARARATATRWGAPSGQGRGPAAPPTARPPGWAVRGESDVHPNGGGGGHGLDNGLVDHRADPRSIVPLVQQTGILIGSRRRSGPTLAAAGPPPAAAASRGAERLRERGSVGEPLQA
jgi:hypothetical protein